MKKIYYRLFSTPPIVLYQKLFLYPVGNFLGMKCGKLFYKLSSEELIQKSKDQIFTGTNSLWKFIVNIHINDVFQKLSDAEKRKWNRSEFWGNEAGENWHRTRASYYDDKKIFFEHYLVPRQYFIDRFNTHIKNEHISNVIEVGTGSGKFLAHLATQHTNETRFTGIDLNERIIKENNKKYGSVLNLKFIYTELLDYLKTEHVENTCIIGTGTFEMFTQNELEELLSFVSSTYAHVSFAICEPVDKDFDKQENSTAREMITFNSHNYISLFKKYGFRIISLQMPFLENALANNMISLIAAK